MKYIELRQKCSEPVFSRQDLRLFGEKTYACQLSSWVKKKYITKLKNGLFVFTDSLPLISAEEIANRIFSPSYISLEKALSHYGIIPEIVYSITSVTPKTTRNFKNTIGNFSFRHIKPSLFFGYKELQGTTLPYFLAEPEKALLDYLYFNLAKIKDKEDLKELRFNQRQLAEIISPKRLRSYLKHYKNLKLEEFAKQLTKG